MADVVAPTSSLPAVTQASKAQSFPGYGDSPYMVPAGYPPLAQVASRMARV